MYPTTIVGPPPRRLLPGRATERVMLPLLRTLIPDIEDYHLPMFGAFHNGAFIRIRKQYPLHARQVMHAVWGRGRCRGRRRCSWWTRMWTCTMRTGVGGVRPSGAALAWLSSA
ncbi:MAG: UbiD family decarboxylase [Phycisphaerales bacterium]